MIEVYGDLFEFDADITVISTNGFVRSDNSNVMGRGCALKAAKLWPTLPKLLGARIKLYGNRVHSFVGPNCDIVTFPVKPVSSICAADKSNIVTHMRAKFKAGDRVPGWACIADKKIIEQSCIELVDLVNKNNWNKVVMPRVGSGAGELNYEKDVKAILNKHLDDRFFVITF